MSCNISIFCKRAFLNIDPNQDFDPNKKHSGKGHLQRVSSMIRGDQIADYLGAKLNPKEGYENDVCIYVKPRVEKGNDFKFEGKPYLDIIDGHNLGQLAMNHPDVSVIVCSQADQKTMSSILPNKVIVIPQHHCNFDRSRRLRGQLVNIGIIGTDKAFEYIPKALRMGLVKRGFNLIEYSKFFTRQDIIDFYLKLDLQLVWRPYKKILSNPLKLVNAASFGIPTLALDEPAFKELHWYLPVLNVEEFFIKLDELVKNPAVYENISHNCLQEAEKYHIDNIAKLYTDLCMT